MTSFKELTGKKFGKFTVIERVEAPEDIKIKRMAFWLIECDCGNRKIVPTYYLTTGKITQCNDCKKEEVIINRIKREEDNKQLKRFKSIWYKMKERCKPEYKESQWYYEKGIKVCDRWLTFENFKEDMYESYLEFEKVNGLNSATIDRIDSNKGYNPDNCKWSTYTEQARNRSSNVKVTVNGVEYNTLTELGEAYGIKQHTIINRYHRGDRGLDLIRPLRIWDSQKNQSTNN